MGHREYKAGYNVGKNADPLSSAIDEALPSSKDHQIGKRDGFRDAQYEKIANRFRNEGSTTGTRSTANSTGNFSIVGFILFPFVATYFGWVAYTFLWLGLEGVTVEKFILAMPGMLLILYGMFLVAIPLLIVVGVVCFVGIFFQIAFG